MTTIPACTHNRFGCCYLCSDHLSWWKEVRIKKGYGETPPNKSVWVLSPCSVQGCTSQKLYAKGFCYKHYQYVAYHRRKAYGPRVTEAEVEAYWQQHTHMTFAEAETALKVLKANPEMSRKTVEALSHAGLLK